MSLIPVFKLGLWNAWIFILPVFLLTFIGNKLIKKRMMTSLSEAMSDLSKREKNIVTVLGIPIFGSYFYSIFLPLKLGAIWFYIGIVIYVVGFSIQIIAWQNLATSSLDKPVTKGIYHISRNPMYIGDFLTFISIAIASLSWIFLLIGIISIIANYFWVISEERECLTKYGDNYREYMDKIPRWIGKPKSNLVLHSNNEKT